ncbi:MAG: asparagine synthase (glutamine-hydrolyzing) [Candidatus Altiarchaeota archaeon]
MCGIVGAYNFRGENVAEDDLRRSASLLTHRGPDSDGFYCEKNTGLGFRRLSIIDLKTGDQPIHNEDERIWVIFNGEIYNHLQIREELEGKGHAYYTNSDTETIVHAYEEYGIDCVKKFNGMFAFAIWDSKSRRFFLARDRLGIKPLYYLLDSDRLIFASELKSIIEFPTVKRELNREALDYYLSYNYVPAPHSIFEGIRKLQPGHTLTVGERSSALRRYWQLTFPHRPYVSLKYFETRIVELLKQAVKARLMSDVPLGAFLSGGIDSSAIVAMMSEISDEPVKTFSIGFEEESYNELQYAKTIAETFNTEHTEFVVKMDAISLLEKLAYHFDEPFADSSAIPTYIVSEMARKHVTVCLSGDGGDEQFGGYDRYRALNLARQYARIPSMLKAPARLLMEAMPSSARNKSFINFSKRFVEAADLPPIEMYAKWVTSFDNVEKSMLYGGKGYAGFDHIKVLNGYYDECTLPDFLGKTMYADINTYMVDDILTKVDRMSMANSLEVRVPFLDHNMVEFTATIPSNLKVRGQTLKYVFKKAVKDILPQQILKRKKRGFGVPLARWFNDELRDTVDSLLLGNEASISKYLDRDEIRRIVDDHAKSRRDNSGRIWNLMMLEMWHRKYMNG